MFFVALGVEFRCKPEVSEFNYYFIALRALSILAEDIFGLQVTMHNVLAVHEI